MTQYARPSSDITTTNVTGKSDSTLWHNVDESSYSDSDWNYTLNNTAVTYETKLSSVTLGGSGSWIVNFRIGMTNSNDVGSGAGQLFQDTIPNDFNVVVSLVQGTTIIRSYTVTMTPATYAYAFQAGTFTLTSGEVAAITDGSNLRLRFAVAASGGTAAKRAGCGISWCELQAPDAVTEQYAVKDGTFGDTTVWSTGVVPTSGIAYANGFNVTISSNRGCGSVRTTAGTVAAAGGSFILSNGVTLTADCYAGTGTCVTAATGVTATIIGNLYGGSLTNTYGLSKAGTGTITVTGNAYGMTAHGIINTGSGTVALSGNCYGSDTSATAYGVRNSSSGTITVGGNSYAGTAGAGAYISSSGTLTISGHSYANGAVPGTIHSGTSNNVTIGGNAYGSTSILGYGIQCISSGSATITGAAISPASPGVGAGVGVTGTGTATTVGSVQTGTGGGSPCVGHVHVADISTFTALIRTMSSSATLSATADIKSPFATASCFGGD